MAGEERDRLRRTVLGALKLADRQRAHLVGALLSAVLDAIDAR